MTWLRLSIEAPNLADLFFDLVARIFLLLLFFGEQF
jgi:hypothetical protein